MNKNNLKSKIFLLIAFLFALLFTTGGTVHAQSNRGRTASPAAASAYWTGSGGRGESIAVMPMESRGLNASEEYIPIAIQGVLVEAFQRFSAMSVLDRENLPNLIREGESGFYAEDNEIIRLGQAANTKYFLSGMINKTQTGFNIQIKITETANANSKATFNENYRQQEFENLSAIRKMSGEILARMGITLTQAGQTALLGTESSNQAHIANARGIIANNQGNIVQAMDFFTRASVLDPNLLDAARNASSTANAVKSGNLGLNIQNEVRWYNEWIKILRQADEYYAANPPYEVLYEPSSLERKNINLTRGTIDISFNAWLIETESWKVIMDIQDGLENTGRAGGGEGSWGLFNRGRGGNLYFGWPQLTELRGTAARENNWVTQYIGFISTSIKVRGTAELVNSSGKVIGKINIEYLPGRRSYTFTGVNANEITDNLTIKLTAYMDYNSISSAAVKRNFKNGDLAVSAIDYNQLLMQCRPFTGFRFSSGGIYLFAPRGAYKKGETFVVPERVGCWQVIGIGGMTRLAGKNLTVVLPESLLYIEDKAFLNSSITSINFPKNLRRIGYDAFQRSALKGIITIPNYTGNMEYGGVYHYHHHYFKDSLVTGFVHVMEADMENLNGIISDIAEFYIKNGRKAGTYTVMLKNFRVSYKP